MNVALYIYERAELLDWAGPLEVLDAWRTGSRTFTCSLLATQMSRSGKLRFLIPVRVGRFLKKKALR
jgi:hypothetical protein